MTSETRTGDVEITLAGKAFVLRATPAAVLEIEERTGVGLTAIALRIGRGEISLKDLTAVVTAGLKAAGEPASHDKVCRMIFETGMMELTEPVGAFLLAAVTGGRALEEIAPAEAEGAPVSGEGGTAAGDSGGPAGGAPAA